MGNRNRTAGHSFERETVLEFRELGWEKACTSRAESKNLDDAGVDICFTDPYSVQCKWTDKAPNFHTLLDSMPKDGKTNVVFHKRKHGGTVVVMKKEDFYKLVKQT